MAGQQVSNLYHLLKSLFWMLDEKIHIQELAGISGEDYINMYKLHLGERMDASIFPDSPPKKLLQAPKRIVLRGTHISSYRRSLGSIKFVRNQKARLGRSFKRYRPEKVIGIRGGPMFGPAVPNSTRDQSPEI